MPQQHITTSEERIAHWTNFLHAVLSLKLLEDFGIEAVWAASGALVKHPDDDVVLGRVMPDQHFGLFAFELAVKHGALERRPVHRRVQLGPDFVVEVFLGHVTHKKSRVDESVGTHWTAEGELISLRLLLRRGRRHR